MGQSLALHNTGELIKIYCAQAMKYYKQEHEPLTELLGFRQSRYEEYAADESKLNDRKEALFKSKDISKWEFSGDMIELVGRKHDLLADRKKAYAFILSDESQKLQDKKEIVNFFTNQMLAELRRVGKNNGEALIDHFVAKT